jgi:hypothetical protein
MLLLFLLLTSGYLRAQVTLSANGPGSTYELIESVLGSGTAGEVPDCGHASFGRHITEEFDNQLNKNVFVFHIHVTPDNDRCNGSTDRQRNEIKTQGSSPANLKGALNETVTYRWKFKIDAGFIPTANFCHIHQIKAGDGDDGAPLITITPRAGNPQKLQIIHSTGSGGTGGEIHSVNLSSFKGVWVEVFEKVKYSTSGTYEVVIKRVSDGATLLSYSNNNINMWRDGTTFCRPKWGIYRSLNSISELRDEQVRFADFCIAEGSAVCPSGVGGGNPPATFTPAADAYVRSGSYAGTAHGATDPNILITKLNSSGSADNDRQTYVRFNLAGTGANITSAVLKLYGKIDDSRSSNVPIGVFSVSSTSWSESTITWNNKPATSAAALATTAVTDATARYYSWDVTSYVQSELNAGRTQVSFALKSAQITDPRITFNSKETGSNPPQLEISSSSSAAFAQTPVVYKNELPSASADLTLNVYPNPVAQQAIIDLNLKSAGSTTVTVYDMQQRIIAVLLNARLQAGPHRTVFNAQPVLPGAYIISVLHNGKTLTKTIARQ